MHPQSKAKRNKKIYQIQFLQQLTNNLEEDSKYGGRKRHVLKKKKKTKKQKLFCSVPQISLNRS